MYLNERLSSDEAVHGLVNDEESMPSENSVISAISHVSAVVETDNFACARDLKAGKNQLIQVLSQFPATAAWLLTHYQQLAPEDSDNDNTALSESTSALNVIKQTYALAQQYSNDLTLRTELSTAVQTFPFNFEELTELTELVVYAFKIRGLHYASAHSLYLEQKYLVNKRLANKPRHIAQLTQHYQQLLADYGDENFLFLSSQKMYELFPELVSAERLWLKSRQKLVSANARLVLFIANQYKSHFLDFDDLVQEGQTGLLKAVDRFNPDLGFQFSTYSSYWIRKAISRALSRCERVVRVPCGQMAVINRVYRAKDELTLKTGKEPTISALAEYINMSEQEINTILSISQTAMSLENVDEEEESMAPIDFLEQHTFTHAFVEIADNDLNRLLNKAIKTLNPREAKVIGCHFGLDVDHEMTLQEIGTELNLTRERVRQIQVMALNKMKRHYGEQLLSFL